MSKQSFAAEQLLELLLQLKKTTPTAAKQILNSQPQIAYALITLMVSMNAINFDVFQKTLADFGANAAAQPQAPLQPPNAVPSSSSTPVPAMPHHVQASQAHYGTATPPNPIAPAGPSHYPYPNGQTATAQPYVQPPANPGYAVPPQHGYGYQQTPPNAYNSYQASYGTPQPAPPNPSMLPGALAAIPDEQKALIMRVLSMTPEQINQLPPSERGTYIQLRATLGVPTG